MPVFRVHLQSSDSQFVIAKHTPFVHETQVLKLSKSMFDNFNTLFDDAKHSVWDSQTQCFASQNTQISASKILFDIFNTYRRPDFSQLFTLLATVPHLFCNFFPVKIFHHFSTRNKILTSLARFLLGGQ